MYLGVDYYPEHWERERWNIDTKLMEEAGIEVVRLAEFAWSKLEPEDEVYDFSWLDEVISILSSHNIKVILCTPTAAPPAWLIDKHPEILPINRNGQRMSFGARRHYCITSKTYYYYSERIIRKMAEHYKDNPQVIGWQVDNEFGGPKCYCENCRKEFQLWLKRRYGTLENLNKSWGNAFWSHDYTVWEQIPLPVVYYHNPAFDLDFRRFFSDMTVRYSNMQIRLLKELNPDKFVTHNFMGLFPELDYYELAKEYDFVSWDNYPRDPSNRYRVALAHDVMRGLKKKNFWIMEEQCSYLTREDITRTFPPGEMRLWTYHCFAHGAETVVYFRWRACNFGIEQFHSGILQHDGTDNSISYKELKQIGKEMERIGPKIENAKTVSPVAIIYDYENIWVNCAYQEKPMYDYPGEILRFYRAIKRLGINVDIVRPIDDFSSYKVVIAPLLYIMTDEIAKNIKDYVSNGGIFIAGFRCAIKDKNSNMLKEVLPGKLRDLFGISIYAWDNIRDRIVELRDASGRVYKGDTFADLITPEGAEVLVQYNSSWYTPYAAVTVNNYGKGKAYYVGCGISQEFYDVLMEQLLSEYAIKDITFPEEVEINVREKGGKRFIFITNFNDKAVTIEVKNSKTDLISDKPVQGEIELSPFGTMVLEE